MKRILVMAAVLSVVILVLAGCNAKDIINVEIENPFDLRVQVWDTYLDAPHAGALVTVLETNDASHSGPDGWTDMLKVPANANRVRVVVEWFDRHGFAHSTERTLGLEHQVVTEHRVAISTRPPN